MANTANKKLKKTNNDATTKSFGGFLISDDLIPQLEGMESRNWSTNISRNGVKTITVTFREAQSTTAVAAK